MESAFLLFKTCYESPYPFYRRNVECWIYREADRNSYLESSKKHRTTLGHFLKNGSWNENYLLRQTKKQIMQKVDSQEPVFLLLDDTLCEKCKPSSQANHPTESCGYHFSHTSGKSVWGHQVLQLMLKIQNQAFAGSD